MRVRYTGPDKARDLPVPGGLIQFPRNKWVDIEAACDAALIPLHHLDVIIPSLVEQDDWELDGRPGAKARNARKRAEARTTELIEANADDPAPDPEEST